MPIFAPALSSLNSAAAFVATDETTTSGSYVDLTTTTDSVTVNTGASALILIQASCWASAAGVGMAASVAISGATTVAAGGTGVPLIDRNTSGTTSNDKIGLVGVNVITNLTAGSNTFKMKYLVGGAVTGHFSNRRIVVIPL